MQSAAPELDRYLSRILPEREPTLARMEALARRKDFPIIGPQVGRLLYQYARLIRARRVFELGSGFGYSAFWFSLALGARGEIHLTDSDEENLIRAGKFLRQGKLKSRYRFHLGDALESLEGVSGKFDIILNDIDKVDYPEVIEQALARLKRGGLLITDNVIWSGKVY
ncbi:MAG: O-methyltransferase, partial [Candidatus Zixiibacteriota bacterium]